MGTAMLVVVSVLVAIILIALMHGSCLLGVIVMQAIVRRLDRQGIRGRR